MINLLPDTTKKELRAARANVVLLRYNFIALAALGLLAVLCLVFYVFLVDNQNQKVAANKDNVEQAAKYDDTKKAADEYRANLATAKTILNNEVIYTDTIFQISALLPKGVILDNINLNAKDFGSQTVFAIRAQNYAAATQLKNNFENSKLFDNVFFQTLTDSTATEGATAQAYPIMVNISVKINKVQE